MSISGADLWARVGAITREARIAQLERYRDHYAERERAFVPSRPDDPRNPFEGLRRATERVLERLRREDAAGAP